MSDPLVKDWMTGEVITVSPATTLPEVHRLMSKHRIRRVPVVEGDKLVGIVTLGDVREASPSDATLLSIFELNYLLAELKVRRIMSRDPITVTPLTHISRAAQLMLDNKVSGLPVVERGKMLVMGQAA